MITQLNAFRQRAISWFTVGTHHTKRMILQSVGLNFRLTDKKLSYEAFLLLFFGIKLWKFLAHIYVNNSSVDTPGASADPNLKWWTMLGSVGTL